MIAQPLISSTYDPRATIRSFRSGKCLGQVKVSRRTSIAAEGDKDLLSNIAEDLQGEEDSQSSARKGFGAPQPKPKAKRKAPEDRPFQVQNPLSDPPSQADQWEANIASVLALLFILFFCEGIFLAIAGFLPEAADNFAINYVYPAFSPTLGVFLAISVVYGLIKTRQGGSS